MGKAVIQRQAVGERQVTEEPSGLPFAHYHLFPFTCCLPPSPAPQCLCALSAVPLYLHPLASAFPTACPTPEPCLLPHGCPPLAAFPLPTATSDPALSPTLLILCESGVGGWGRARGSNGGGCWGGLWLWLKLQFRPHFGLGCGAHGCCCLCPPWQLQLQVKGWNPGFPEVKHH